MARLDLAMEPAAMLSCGLTKLNSQHFPVEHNGAGLTGI